MKSQIFIQKIWFDDHVIELKIEVSDRNSTFSNKVYTSQVGLEKLAQDLESFREQVYGGIYDITMGGFGPEYANGGFLARLHFQPSGKLCISIYQQSDFEDFSVNKVASEARFYLKTEPSLLDNFISELKSLSAGKNDQAKFECI